MTNKSKPLEELSDREIDALVAEKIMGTDLGLASYKHDYELLVQSGAWNGSYESFLDNQDLWSPSTDFNAAFEVVEKMKELSVKVVISIETDGDHSVQCGDIIVNEPLWSIPKMICVAALMWKDADAKLNKLKTDGVE